MWQPFVLIAWDGIKVFCCPRSKGRKFLWAFQSPASLGRWGNNVAHQLDQTCAPHIPPPWNSSFLLCLGRARSLQSWYHNIPLLQNSTGPNSACCVPQGAGTSVEQEHTCAHPPAGVMSSGRAFLCSISHRGQPQGAGEIINTSSFSVASMLRHYGAAGAAVGCNFPQDICPSWKPRAEKGHLPGMWCLPNHFLSPYPSCVWSKLFSC